MSLVDAGANRKKFMAVHVCVECGHAAERQDADGVPSPSGIFRCPVCGHEGQLNIEIRESDPADA